MYIHTLCCAYIVVYLSAWRVTYNSAREEKEKEGRSEIRQKRKGEARKEEFGEAAICVIFISGARFCSLFLDSVVRVRGGLFIISAIRGEERD
jgi:hypothetical protein